MGSVRGQAKRLESVISICILAILVLIGAGVFLKQFDSDISRFGMGTMPAHPEAAESESNRNYLDFEYLTPAGFERLSAVETYTAENLYEKINGKAPQYTESGFVKLFTQRFANKNDNSLTAELYVFDMGGARNAFSVYSVQRRAGTEALAEVKFGYKTSNAMYFVRGKYYIELVGYSESQELLGAMSGLVGRIWNTFPGGDDAELAEIKLFPRENVVTGSVKFYLSSAFGCEGLTDVFVCKYRVREESITAFLSKRADAKEAEQVAENYYEFLLENGAAVKVAFNETLKGRVLDFYDTTEIVLSAGPFVVGVHEAENQEAAEEVVLRLISELSTEVKAI